MDSFDNTMTLMSLDRQRYGKLELADWMTMLNHRHMFSSFDVRTGDMITARQCCRGRRHVERSVTPLRVSGLSQ